MDRIEHTQREIEIFRRFQVDGTARKLENHSPRAEINFLNSIAFRSQDFMEDGEPNWDKYENLIEGFFKHLDGKRLREYRGALKRHLKRLKITYPEYKSFTRKVLINSMIDRTALNKTNEEEE